MWFRDELSSLAEVSLYVSVTYCNFCFIWNLLLRRSSKAEDCHSTWAGGILSLILHSRRLTTPRHKRFISTEASGLLRCYAVSNDGSRRFGEALRPLLQRQTVLEEVTLPDHKHEDNVGKLITSRHGVTPRRTFDPQQHPCESLKSCKSYICLKVPLQGGEQEIWYFFMTKIIKGY